MNAKRFILLQEKAKTDEPWNSTRGIYADFSDGFDQPKYFCRCPNCNVVHGHYKTPREALSKKICAGCHRTSIEKLQKEIRNVDKPQKRQVIEPKPLFAESLVANLLD